MQKKKLIKAILATFLLIFIISRGVEVYSSNKNISYETYIVQHGDTLWSIAKDCNLENIRKTVHIIRTKNNITPVIYPGQVIDIPVTKDGGANE